MIRKFDYNKLEQLVSEKEVLKNKHPEKDLYVYSYNKVWYPDWTQELKWARGLVLDPIGNVIACPFEKFFNSSEVHSELVKRTQEEISYKIQEKLDGSLGILFFYDGEWILNTRGSFASEQAIKGKQILEDKYPNYKNLDPAFTYLFEIIYPENQIVINYAIEQMILLAVMNPHTMEEVQLKSVYIPKSFDIVPLHETLTLEYILKTARESDFCNAEGFVVVYEDGYRVKVKYDEYVRLHKIVSDFKPIAVIELMRDGGDIDELINSLPDEFREDIIQVKKKTEFMYEAFCSILIQTFMSINTEDRKEFALKAVTFDGMKAHLFEIWKQYYNGSLNRIKPTKEWIKSTKNLNVMVYEYIISNYDSVIL